MPSLSSCLQSRAAGADILWRKYGPSITVTRGQQRQIAYLETTRLGVTLQASAGFPQPPFDAARTTLAAIGTGAETKDAWYCIVPLAEASDAQLASALDAAQALAEALRSSG